MKRQVDLSSPITALDINENEESSTSILLSADAVGNYGGLMLITPYGYLGENTLRGNSWKFNVSSTENVPVCNPFDYNGIWMQTATEDRVTYTKAYMSTSAISFIGSSATLPSLNPNLGPNEGFGINPLSYSNGVLSFPPLSGAKFYHFTLEDIGSGDDLGIIMTPNASISFPDWLKNTLNGLSVEFNFMGMDMDEDWDLSLLGRALGEFAPPDNIKIASALPLGSGGLGEGYKQTIGF